MIPLIVFPGNSHNLLTKTASNQPKPPNLAAASEFSFCPPMLRASSFSSIYKPTALLYPNYVKPHSCPTHLPQQPTYHQHASSTPWCRADSGSQRSHQTYCRSSAPSSCSPAAVSTSLDRCSPIAWPAACSSPASSPAEPRPWSLRPDGLDRSVSCLPRWRASG